MRRLALLCAGLFCVLGFHIPPARAEMRVCNQTSYVLYAAIGYESGTQMLTRGWTRIVPGDCAITIEGPLTQPAYFLYARSSQAHRGPAHAWGGPIRLCAREVKFAFDLPVGASHCASDDAYLMPFTSIATGHATTWTTTLTESSTLSSPELARQAGIGRLLGDIGYKTDLDGARGNKARNTALADFRARMHMPARANFADLFDALETEAFKAAAPEGYSICNDGSAELWAAIGLREANAYVSRGWWDIPAGACAKALTTPLATDKVYLYARKHGNPKLVTGPATFCTTDIAFEIYSDARCAARGLTDTGFAVTHTKCLTGYAAHIGNDGLLPPAPSLTKSRARR